MAARVVLVDEESAAAAGYDLGVASDVERPLDPFHAEVVERLAARGAVPAVGAFLDKVRLRGRPDVIPAGLRGGEVLRHPRLLPRRGAGSPGLRGARGRRGRGGRTGVRRW